MLQAGYVSTRGGLTCRHVAHTLYHVEGTCKPLPSLGPCLPLKRGGLFIEGYTSTHYYAFILICMAVYSLHVYKRVFNAVSNIIKLKCSSSPSVLIIFIELPRIYFRVVVSITYLSTDAVYADNYPK